MNGYECDKYNDDLKECSCNKPYEVGINFGVVNKKVEEIKDSIKPLSLLTYEDMFTNNNTVERYECEVDLPNRLNKVDGEKDLIDFPPWKNESSGIKEVSQELEKDDLEDGCFIDYSDLDTSLKERVDNFKEEMEFKKETEKIRKFETGGVRDSDKDKLDFEGFLSPLVIEEFSKYMHKHRLLSNGEFRNSDNWQLGFGGEHFSVCMKSLWRHFFDLWKEHRGYKSREGIEDALNGILFNVMAYYHKFILQKK